MNSTKVKVWVFPNSKVVPPQLRGIPRLIAFLCPSCIINPYMKFHYASLVSLAGSKWSWNGNFQAPTITSSLKVTKDMQKSDNPHLAKKHYCHCTVTNGRVEFHKDHGNPNFRDRQGIELPLLSKEEYDNLGFSETGFDFLTDDIRELPREELKP